MATDTVSLLAAIGRIPPEAWDTIIPHGATVRVDPYRAGPWVSARGSLAIAAAEMTHEMVKSALAPRRDDGSAYEFVAEFVDDWCGTKWPHKWPLPWPGPHPGDGPILDPEDARMAQLVGAVVLASVCTRLRDDELASSFAEGAERLAAGAMS